MSDFPNGVTQATTVITPYHVNSVGLSMSTIGALGSATSGAWPSNNLAFYYPFRLYTRETAYQLLFWVGATQGGNIDVGIYDSQNNKIVSSGTTAMSATVNTVQELNITDTVLPPGDYMLGVSCSSTSGTYFGSVNADELGLSSALIFEQATALPLPDPCVPVLSTQSTPPLVAAGIQLRSVF